MKKGYSKILYLEVLRILACYLVIVNHSTLLIMPNSDIAWILYYFRFILCKIAVPLFFMISGYLLLRKDYSYRDILKKVLRILIPLLICSVIAYLRFFPKHSISDFVLSFIEQPINNVFLYLYVLMGLYLITPFLRKMIKSMSDNDFKVFTLLILIIPGIIPLIKIIFGISISAFFNQVMFNYVIGYYVLGYYLGNREISKKGSLISLIVSVITIVISVILLFTSFKESGVNSLFLDNTGLITTVLPALGVFVIMKYFISTKNVNVKFSNFITIVSSGTFGVYLFHMLVMNDLYGLPFISKIFSINTFFGVMILDFMLFVGLEIIILILKKVPKVSEFL